LFQQIFGFFKPPNEDSGKTFMGKKFLHISAKSYQG
jgi:hypothetical protein